MDIKHKADREELDAKRSVAVTFRLRTEGVCTIARSEQCKEEPDAAGAGGVGALHGPPFCVHGVPKGRMCAICDPEGYSAWHGEG